MTKDQTPETPEATPANSVMDGQSFYAGHLTGSGTLTEDGQYGPPVPDPTILRGGPKGERVTPGGVDRSVDDRIPPSSPAPAQTKRTGRRTRAEIDASQPDPSKSN